MAVSLMFPLRVHSCYSMMRGTVTPGRLCRLAARYGYPGLALTDRDNLYGLWPFLAACQKEKIRPVIGAEISEPGSDCLVTALVLDDGGYTNLCTLLTRRWLEKGFTLLQEVPKAGSGLVFLSSDLHLLRVWHKKGLRVAADLGSRPTQQGSRLRRWALDVGVTAVATPNSFVATAAEQEVYRLLRAIDLNTSLSEVSGQQRECYLLDRPEVYCQQFAMWPEVMEATCKLARLCRFQGPGFGLVMPPWKQEGEEAGPVLRRDAYTGACRRYGGDLPEMVVERLEHELKIIEAMGFSSYFLVVRDIVHRGRNGTDRIKRRVCGRGSGAASLVAYCLEITNVCPVTHNLYFERFLNPERSDPPDIDIDFAWDERDQVLAEVFGEYGDHVAMVCNHVCFKPRMAIRETAKVFGLPEAEITRMTGRVPWLYRRDGKELRERLMALPSLRDQDFSDPWPEILRLAGKLIGLPRYLSVHPGGVVITPEPVSHYVPVERAAKGVRIIQWEKDGAEAAGLVKIDLLGNRSLGVIRDCIGSIKTGGDGFDERHWHPEQDELTRKNVARGRTMGCFYIESPAMRLLQQKAASGCFDQLVLQSSIIRPAANEFVREYVRRLHGGTYQPLHERVADVLEETFGLMVYQEDVSKVAVALAGFSHGRADGLRKVLSKKDRNLRLPDYKKEFYQGCRMNHLTTRQIDTVWAMIMSFDGYSFCKPHSASYAMVSFQAAWLKSHFPAEFMAAVISNRGGFYSVFAYVSEARRMGLTVLPPDVNESEIGWTGRKGEIRVGLQAIKELSGALMRRIVVERREGNYSCCEDFFQRLRPEDDGLRALIRAGALDCLDDRGNRPAILYQWVSFRRLTEEGKRGCLFPVMLPPPPLLPRQDRREQLRDQYRVLGFLCEEHPVRFYRERAGRGVVRGCDLAHHANRRIRFVGWLLTGKLVSTRTGEAMEFLTFEDETATVETTFFPRVYRRYAHELSSGKPYMLHGLVEEDYGVVTLTVESVNRLKTAGSSP